MRVHKAHDALTVQDKQGVTHETVYHSNPSVGVISLCGVAHGATIVNKTVDFLRVYMRPTTVEGVDCMTCIIRRARIEHLTDKTPPGDWPKVDIRVTSWQ